MPSRNSLAIALLPCALCAGPLAAQAPTLAALDSVIQAELKRTGTPGAQVAVVSGGQIVYAKGFGVADIETGAPVTAGMLFRVGSVSKMFTAALLTTLAENGKLDLQQPIGRAIPELRGRVAQVTPHQLMTHNAGWLDNAIPYGRHDDAAMGEQLRAVTDTMFFTDPGSVYSYSNPGFSMAGFVGEAAGGAPFGTLVQQMVLAPVGMTRSTFRPFVAATWPLSQGHIRASGAAGAAAAALPATPAVTPSAAPAATPAATPTVVRPLTDNVAQWPAGFLFSSAGELARFAIALMNRGMLEGKQVLPARAVERMTTGYVSVPGREADGVKYGYGLQVGTLEGTRLVQHGGSINGFDADVTMLPDRNFAVIVLDNMSGSPLSRIVPAAMKLVAGIEPKPPVPPTESEFTAADRAALAGRFKMGGTDVTIAEQDGKLVLRQNGQEIPLIKLGANRIGFRPPGAAPQAPPTALVTVIGADGRVAYLHQGGRSLARQP